MKRLAAQKLYWASRNALRAVPAGPTLLFSSLAMHNQYIHLPPANT